MSGQKIGSDSVAGQEDATYHYAGGGRVSMNNGSMAFANVFAEKSTLSGAIQAVGLGIRLRVERTAHRCNSSS